MLPAVNHDGNVALTDCRGKSPVLLAMMRGLYCAFCRRHIAQLGTTRRKLQALGATHWPSSPCSRNGCGSTTAFGL
jgi:hypothetical protein